MKFENMTKMETGNSTKMNCWRNSKMPKSNHSGAELDKEEFRSQIRC